MKRNRISQWYSVIRAKSPRQFILVFLLLINIVFFLAASGLIYLLAPESIGSHGYFDSMYYAITMVLDAGCIGSVVEDAGTTGLALIITCLLIVILGMILFTGAAIGYVTTAIGDYIDNSNAGKHRLYISDHTVILNWNSRGSEIVNDLLYSDKKEIAVILAQQDAEGIRQEIEERLYDTVTTDNQRCREESANMAPLPRLLYRRRNKLRRSRLSVIVREGDSFSAKLLNDISIKQARAVIVLCADGEVNAEYDGSANLIRTLIQAADLTAAEDSADNQRLIAEVDDPWTMVLVNRIIARKRSLGKNNIVPLPAYQILGQLISQFAVMPELSAIYEELFSNKGAAFFSRDGEPLQDNNERITDFLKDHPCAVPLTWMQDDDGGYEYFYMAGREKDIKITESVEAPAIPISLNQNFWFSRRNVIILGHNAICHSLMEGFNSFRGEWNYPDAETSGREILNITVIDDRESLARMDYYRSYPYVNQVVEAELFDREKVMNTITRIVDGNTGDTSILILSGEDAGHRSTDERALTYLIYVQDIIGEHLNRPDFDENSIDVVVEILNPKNYDVVKNYSRSNIVISNRYLSKMVTQISEKKEIFNFYRDILSYDEEQAERYTSMELYVKPVGEFFTALPPRCTGAQLIRSVFEAGPADNKSLVLGYVKQSGEVVIFAGDQRDYTVELAPLDKIILFSNH